MSSFLIILKNLGCNGALNVLRDLKVNLANEMCKKQEPNFAKLEATKNWTWKKPSN
jgi:hypothetical protein